MSAARPADRRSFLGGSLALASAVATSAAAPAAPAMLADHPDAALLAMERALAAALHRQQQADEEGEEAYDRYEAPPVPDALVWRPSDVWPVCTDPGKLPVFKKEGARRHFYDDGIGNLVRRHGKLTP